MEIFAIDAGNSSFKLAHFQGDEIQSVRRFNDISELEVFVQKEDLLIISSVIEPEFLQQIQELYQVFVIHAQLKLPFTNAYTTPQTLGVDRICNVAGMQAMQPKGNRLAVDIGTCVKFDFLDKENCYLGGSISPGARLRFQSLHDYTARLPLLEIQRFEDLVGNSSQNAIYAGVMTGMRAEILQMIEMYEQQFGEIQVYLTGGDRVYFDMGKKNNIFATENLTLVGIFQLFKQNASFL
jgi:type III pantothenate kinase